MATMEGKPIESKVVVIGAGCAGTQFAAHVVKHDKSLAGHIVMIDPDVKFLYQPGWTWVGSGVYPDVRWTIAQRGDKIPKGSRWVNAEVTTVDPVNRLVHTANGEKYKYEQLFIGVGIEPDYGAVKGLAERVGQGKVYTIYDLSKAEHASTIPAAALAEARSRPPNSPPLEMIFTSTSRPLKCGGAPLKIAFLNEEYWRKKLGAAARVERFHLQFLTGTGAVFGQPAWAQVIMRLLGERHIEYKTGHELVELSDDVATFRVGEGLVRKRYDYIHVAPPHRVPAFLRAAAAGGSGLTDGAGFVDVDKTTMQHRKFREVFACGDSSNIPTSKTAAAALSQALVAAVNVARVRRGEAPLGPYDGYSSCPLIASRSHLLLAEFKWNPAGGPPLPAETFASVPVLGKMFDQAEPARVFMPLKKYLFPWMYMHAMHRGWWYGRHAFARSEC